MKHPPSLSHLSHRPLTPSPLKPRAESSKSAPLLTVRFAISYVSKSIMIFILQTQNDNRIFQVKITLKGCEDACSVSGNPVTLHSKTER